MKQRNYNCSFCANHNLTISKKEHKSCSYKNCPCQQCDITRNLQLCLKLSIALRRSKKVIQRKRKRNRKTEAQVCDEYKEIIKNPHNYTTTLVQKFYLDKRNDIMKVLYEIVKCCNGNEQNAEKEVQEWIQKGN